MAFNFNWSPLIADTSRARDMLTAALNKSPKPPIIVDDIIVTELNLGSVPPELEILEIGDLAEDRFRGIFKMQYSGDAFMTLKTRVQANPLNTYLSTKPTFASPQPLAAASGLTIPLQITLSDIKLWAFVILVFSRQKGITLVFRNDPLESLKVSSTFDSIPFVRDYLQQEIEGQLRVLFMEDLPAIIHRLSLRLWVPEHSNEMDINSNRLDPPDARDDKQTINPLSSPSQRPRDSGGGSVEDPELSFSLDDSAASQASFSQKNLLRLAALTDSQRTLSLFTPPIRDVVYRAWAGATEGPESRRPPPHQIHGGHGITLASLSHHGSHAPSRANSIYSFSSDPGAAASASAQSYTSRPSLSSYATSSHAYSTGGALPSGRSRAPGARKRKHRVVNLRRAPASEEPNEPGTRSDGADGVSRPSTPTSSVRGSSSWATYSEREGEMQTPPDTPEKRAAIAKSHTIRHAVSSQSRDSTRKASAALSHSLDTGGDSIPSTTPPNGSDRPLEDSQQTIRPHRQHRQKSSSAIQALGPLPMPIPFSFAPSSSTQQEKLATPGAGAQLGGILEQAWMMKMAAEIARKAETERRERSREAEGSADEAFWNGGSGNGKGREQQQGRTFEEEEEEPPPPVYAA